jgi:hypothetical protein
MNSNISVLGLKFLSAELQNPRQLLVAFIAGAIIAMIVISHVRIINLHKIQRNQLWGRFSSKVHQETNTSRSMGNSEGRVEAALGLIYDSGGIDVES